LSLRDGLAKFINALVCHSFRFLQPVYGTDLAFRLGGLKLLAFETGLLSLLDGLAQSHHFRAGQCPKNAQCRGRVRHLVRGEPGVLGTLDGGFKCLDCGFCPCRLELLSGQELLLKGVLGGLQFIAIDTGGLSLRDGLAKFINALVCHSFRFLQPVYGTDLAFRLGGLKLPAFETGLLSLLDGLA